MREQPERPDWWPSYADSGPMTLLEIVTKLQRIRMGKTMASDEWRSLLVQALSHAYRTWQSPSTPYELALKQLCLEAINEANNAASKETK